MGQILRFRRKKFTFNLGRVQRRDFLRFILDGSGALPFCPGGAYAATYFDPVGGTRRLARQSKPTARVCGNALRVPGTIMIWF